MKRPLCMFAGVFVLGEVLTLLNAGLISGLLALLAAGVFGTRIGTGRKEMKVLLPVFCLFGMLCMREALETPAGFILEGEKLPVRAAAEGRISSISIRETGIQIILKDAFVVRREKEYPVGSLLCRLEEDDAEAARRGTLKVGHRIQVSGRITDFSKARNPGEFDFASYYRSQKLYYQLSGSCTRILDSRFSPLLDWIFRLRLYGENQLSQLCSDSDLGIFLAAVLGDKSRLDPEIKDLYQKAGIAHLLAVSGLHMSLAGMGIYGIMRKLRAGYGWAGAASAGAVVLYGILTGGAPSVFRAAVMMLLLFLASYLGRTYDLLSAAGAALILLLWNFPLLLTQGGVQLSFGAVFGIGILGKRWIRELEGLSPRGKTLVISLSVQLATGPIILYHFYEFPPYGIVLNLLVIPLMACVVYSGAFGIALGGFSAAAGVFSIAPGHYVLSLYETLCRFFIGLKGSALVFGRPLWPQLVLYALVLFGGCACISKLNGNRRKSAGICVLAILCFLTLIPLPVRGIEAIFLDVGQGDGIFLQNGYTTILIDGGSSSNKNLGEETLEPFLKCRGVSVLDYVFVSHGDADHINGLEYLLEKESGIRVRNLCLPCLGSGDSSYDRLRSLAGQQGCRIWEVKQGDCFLEGKLKLECLYPGTEDMAADRNEQSQVIKVSYGALHLLFTGDMSGTGEKKILDDEEIKGKLREIQVLKTAHHGSRFSSREEFLSAVDPQWAVISYGEGNSYGHPHQEVLERFHRVGTTVYGTADCGAIFLKSDGKKIDWSSYLR